MAWMLGIVNIGYYEMEGMKFRKIKYLIDAETFTEAEARLIENIEELQQDGMANITSIAYEDYSQVIHSADSPIENHWKVRVTWTEIADNGKEKKYSVSFLAQAETSIDAQTIIEELISDWSVETKVEEVKLTGIVDVFIYNEEI